LFCARLFTLAPRTVEEIASRLCPLPMVFALFSRQTCVSDFRARSCGDSGRNSVVVFSCAKARQRLAKCRQMYWCLSLDRQLVAETNAECARGENEIPIGTDGFQLADGVTDFDRVNLRSCERNHFPKLTGGHEFRSGCAEDRAQRATKRGRRSAALKVPEN